MSELSEITLKSLRVGFNFLQSLVPYGQAPEFLGKAMIVARQPGMH